MIRNFRTKIFLAGVSAVLLALAVLASLFYFQIYPKLIEEQNAILGQRASEARAGAEQLIHMHLQNAKAIGDSLSLAIKSSPEGKAETLNLMRSVYPDYREMALVDAGGNVLASTAENFRNDWWGDGFFLEALSGKAVISDIKKKGESSFVFWAMSPVYGNGGGVAFVAAVEVPLDSIWAAADRVKFGDSGFVFVTDASGRVIAHPNKMLMLKEMPYGFGITGFAPGSIALSDGLAAGRSASSETGWIVFAAQPEAEAYIGATSSANIFILAVLASFAAASFAAYVLSRKIAKPVVELNKGIRTTMAGQGNYDFSVRTEDEIGEIAASFKELTETAKEKDILERLRANQQEKVKELERLNKILIGREKEIARLKSRMLRQNKV